MTSTFETKSTIPSIHANSPNQEFITFIEGGGTKDESHYYNDQYPSTSIQFFPKSVQAKSDDLKRNKYKHHKGPASARPPCVHERSSSWNLGKCNDCGAQLTQARMTKEKLLAERLKEEDRQQTLPRERPHNHRIHSLGIRVEQHGGYY